MAAAGGRRTGAPRRAGVSSFGAGGSNAHVVLEEYRDVRDRSAGLTGPAVVVLSARDGDRLREYAARLRDFVAGAPSATGGATAPDGTLRRLTALAAKVSGVAPRTSTPTRTSPPRASRASPAPACCWASAGSSGCPCRPPPSTTTRP
ncbi:hypothetical protein O1L55_09770 [Streptomyces albulus]|nr:hypothetical protein [Streptomyces noursei]